MRKKIRFSSQSNIDYLDILDYEHIAFIGRECYNDDGGHPIGSSSTSFSFESPIEGDVKMTVMAIFNDSKALRNVGSATNRGWLSPMYVNGVRVKGGGKLNLGSPVTNGEDSTAEMTVTTHIKKGTNTIQYSGAVDRYERIITTSAHFSIKVLVLKVKGEYIPLNI